MSQQITRGYKALVAEAERHVQTLTPAQALAMQGRGAVLVDLRDPRELEREGRIEGAFHCPRGMLEFWIDPESPYHKAEFAGDGPFVFFCGGGWRSALAAQAAQDMGVKPVSHMAGGFAAWKKAGLPVACPLGKVPATEADIIRRTRALLDALLTAFASGDFGSIANRVAYPYLTSDARASYALYNAAEFIEQMDVLRSYFIDSGLSNFRYDLIDIQPLSDVFVRAFVQLSAQGDDGEPVEPIEIGLLFRDNGGVIRLAALADHQPETTGFAHAREGAAAQKDEPFVLKPGGMAHDDLLQRFRRKMVAQLELLNQGRFLEMAQGMGYPCHVSTPTQAGMFLSPRSAARQLKSMIETSFVTMGAVHITLAECELVGASRVFAFLRLLLNGEDASGHVVYRTQSILHVRIHDDDLRVVGFAALDSKTLHAPIEASTE